MFATSATHNPAVALDSKVTTDDRDAKLRRSSDHKEAAAPQSCLQQLLPAGQAAATRFADKRHE